MSIRNIFYCLLVLIFAMLIKLIPFGTIIPGLNGTTYYNMVRAVTELILLLPFFYYMTRRFGFRAQAGIRDFSPRHYWIILLPLIFPGLLLHAGLDTSCGYWSLGFLFFIGYRYFAALFEEMVFRGLIQGYLSKQEPFHYHRVHILSATFFGLVHLMNLRHTFFPSVLAQVVFAFFMGLLFSAIFQWVRNIWMMGLSHALVNILMSGYCSGLQPETTDESFTIMDCIEAVFSMALLMSPTLLIYFLLMYIYKHRKRPEAV